MPLLDYYFSYHHKTLSQYRGDTPFTPEVMKQASKAGSIWLVSSAYLKYPDENDAQDSDDTNDPLYEGRGGHAACLSPTSFILFGLFHVVCLFQLCMCVCVCVCV